MSIVIPEFLAAYEAAADAMIAKAENNAFAPSFEVRLVTISIALRMLESDKQQDFNNQYFNELTVVLMKKGYTRKSIYACSDFIRFNRKPAEFFELDADGQDAWRDAEREQAIALLEKAATIEPAKRKIKASLCVIDEPFSWDKTPSIIVISGAGSNAKTHKIPAIAKILNDPKTPIK